MLLRAFSYDDIQYITNVYFNIYKYIYIYIYIFMDKYEDIYILAQLAGTVEYTDWPFAVLDMTLNNLMVRFQWFWSFGECGVPLHYHCSQVHSGQEW